MRYGELYYYDKEAKAWTRANNIGTLPGMAEQYSGVLTPEQFGAKGDGLTDDFEAIKKCLGEGTTRSVPVFFRCGAIYATSNPIDVYETNIQGNGSALKALTEIPYLLKVSSFKPNSRIDNLCFDCQAKATGGLIVDHGDATRLHNIIIKDCVGTAYVHNAGGVFLYEMSIKNDNEAHPGVFKNSKGMTVSGWDSHYTDVEIINTSVALEAHGPGCRYTRFHPWNVADYLMNTAVAFDITKNCMFLQTMNDTFSTGFFIHRNDNILVYETQNFWLRDVFNAEVISTPPTLFKFDDASCTENVIISGMYASGLDPAIGHAKFSNVASEEWLSGQNVAETVTQYTKKMVDGIPGI